MRSKRITRLCPVCGTAFTKRLETSNCSRVCGDISRRQDPVRRFWSRVKPGPNGCLDWTGHLNPNGYGNLRVNGKKKYAHDFAYEMAHGPIPEGLEPDHTCKRECCVNEAHLELVTHRENTRRGDGAPGIHARATHCVNGHEFTPANTVIRYGQWRVCRTCRKANNDRSTERRRQERAKRRAA